MTGVVLRPEAAQTDLMRGALQASPGADCVGE